MNQEQYIMIKKVLYSGCPACAEELCNSLDNLVNGYNALAKELKSLKTSKTDNEKEEK